MEKDYPEKPLSDYGIDVDAMTKAAEHALIQYRLEKDIHMMDILKMLKDSKRQLLGLGVSPALGMGVTAFDFMHKENVPKVDPETLQKWTAQSKACLRIWKNKTPFSLALQKFCKAPSNERRETLDALWDKASESDRKTAQLYLDYSYGSHVINIQAAVMIAEFIGEKFGNEALSKGMHMAIGRANVRDQIKNAQTPKGFKPPKLPAGS